MKQEKNAVYVRLGRRLRQYRDKKRLSQETLAEEIGVSKTTICNIESGAKGMRIETLVVVCNILEIPSDALLMDSLEHALAAESHEILELLHGCTKYERQIMIDMLKACKRSLRDNSYYLRNH